VWDPRPGDGGNGEHGRVVRRANRGPRRAGRKQVRLGDDDDVRLGRELGAIQRALAAQQLIGALGIGTIGRDQNGDEPRAFHVLQEPQAQSLPGVRPLDDARDVGHHEAAMPRQRDHAEVRLEGGERIVGDFRPRGRDHREQGALAGVWLAEQAHVGDQLEHQLEGLVLAELPRFPLPWRLMRRRRELRVAASGATTLGNEQFVAGGDQLAQQRSGAGIPDFGARRHGQEEIHSGSARHLFAFPVLATFRLPFGAVPVVEQRREVGVGPHEDAAAGAAVAAVRSALGDELFSSERTRTRPAGAAPHVDDGAINEHAVSSLTNAECGMRNAELNGEFHAPS